MLSGETACDWTKLFFNVPVNVGYYMRFCADVLLAASFDDFFKQIILALLSFATGVSGEQIFSTKQKLYF